MTVEVLERVLIIDDDPDSREAYAFTVHDADLQAVPVAGPLGSLNGFVAAEPMDGAGALCDFELSAKNFATFTGAELVSAWYQTGVPAVLCTRYEKAQLDRIRPYRRWIPRLLTPSELDPDSLRKGLGTVQAEIAGDFVQSRVAYRTLIRVVEHDPDDARNFLFEMPAWSTDLVVRSRITDVPLELRSQIQPGFRAYVHANLGAETYEDLYFTNWSES